MTDFVIFDCDGVLIDSEVLSAEVLIAELAGHGIAVDRAYVRRHFLGRSFPTVAKTIREEFRTALSPDFEARYRARLLERFETDLRTTDGIEAVLEAMTVPFCVATSSSPPRVTRSLEITGLGRYFADRVFTASEVARGKPAPDLFLHAASRMGAEPRRTLVVEDSAPGVEAALAAGMEVVVYTGGQHMGGEMFDTTVPVRSFGHWSEFGAILAGPGTKEPA